VNVRWNPGWEKQVLDSPEVGRLTAEAADRIVEVAQARAPKRTGAGAASIHKERDGDGYAISWDPAHDYMRFAEFGTAKETPRPFLRSAVHAVER
jgi:HK97 gp10 family phage protein